MSVSNTYIYPGRNRGQNEVSDITKEYASRIGESDFTLHQKFFAGMEYRKWGLPE